MGKDRWVSATQRPMLAVSAPAPRDAAEIITREQSPADLLTLPHVGQGTKDASLSGTGYRVVSL